MGILALGNMLIALFAAVAIFKPQRRRLECRRS